MLNEISIFKSAPQNLLDQIESQAEKIQIGPGEFIFEEGSSADKMYIILSGEVDIYKKIEGVNQKINTLTTGDFFGETALVTQEKRNATVISKTPTTLLAISRDLFDEIFGKEANLTTKISEAITERLSDNDLARIQAQRDKYQ